MNGSFNEAHARALRPGLVISTTMTLEAYLDPKRRNLVNSMLEATDFVSVTIYPMDDAFVFQTIPRAMANIEELLAIFAPKPIYIQEIGYSSGSEYVGSSEQQQANFYREMFRFWDRHSERIPYISILNLYEWSQTTVDNYGIFYGMCPSTFCEPFKEYLQTLGIRVSASQAKPAFTVIHAEAKARGW